MKNLDLEILVTMCRAHFRVEASGFHYIKHIIRQALEHRNYNLILTESSAELAVKYQVKPNSIDSAIRHSVMVANASGMKDALNEMFGRQIVGEEPTVKMAIVYLMLAVESRMLEEEPPKPAETSEKRQ